MGGGEGGRVGGGGGGGSEGARRRRAHEPAEKGAPSANPPSLRLSLSSHSVRFKFPLCRSEVLVDADVTAVLVWRCG